MNLKESQKVELKKSLSQLDEALKAICAFLNHKGGKVYFGVDDKGKIIGLEVTDKTLRKISQQIHSRIKPEIAPEIKEIKQEGKSTIEVIIPEGANKPYFLNGIAYKRVGTENRIIPPDELKKIILEQKQTRWDEEICDDATLKDIDEKAVRDFLEKAKRERNYETQPGLKLGNILEKLGLMIDNKLTNAAILFFGKNPQKFFPQAEVRCARFKGNDVTSPFIDMKIISGRLPEQIEKAEEFVLFNIKKAAWIEPGVARRIEKFEYPPEAIREAIVNAICHRDYRSSGNVQIRIFDEKMEIWNPGTLPEGITVESLKKQHLSKPRNKSIAKLLFLTKHIEQWGSGTNKMVEVCIKEGLPEPEFIELKNDFYVTLTRSRVNLLLEKPGLLNQRQREAIEYLKIKNVITSSEYKEIFKCSERTARMDLKKLVELQVVKQVGRSKNIRYILNDAFRQFPAISGNE